MRGAERSPEYRAKRAHLGGRIAAARGEEEEATRRYLAALDAAAEVGLRDLPRRLHADLARVRRDGEEGPEGAEDRARARLLLDDLAQRILDPQRRERFLSRDAVRAVLGHRVSPQHPRPHRYNPGREGRDER